MVIAEVDIKAEHSANPIQSELNLLYRVVLFLFQCEIPKLVILISDILSQHFYSKGNSLQLATQCKLTHCSSLFIVKITHL